MTTRTSAAFRRIAAGLCCLAAASALPRNAAAQSPMESSWRIGAGAGAFVPRSALIAAADGSDTELAAAPSFSLELQYLASQWAAAYGSGTTAFSSITLGRDISTAVTGPSHEVLLLAFTGGVVLTAPTGAYIAPTLRLGAGIKGYSFDLKGAENQWRPTGDFGVGFRGPGNGPVEVSAELRYLPSSFDQARLPTRAITPQEQRQTDLLFAIGVSIRP